MTARLRGVFAPVLTPFGADLSPDADRLAEHCRWLVGQGSGLAVFGTNSEGNSLSVEERLGLLERLCDAGIDPARMMPGTGCCALPDTVRLTARAVALRCGGVLMLPPFYYKGVSEDGLFRYFAEVVQRVGDARLRIYLYHIPSVAQVPITHGLVARLLASYPAQIAGMKDSSGDWEGTRGFLDAFAGAGFDVFVGSEAFLLRGMRHGGVGAISATANVNPASIDRLFRTWRDADADEQQARLDETRAVFQRYPMLPALKATVAIRRGDPTWATLRPPLVPLTDDQQRGLAAELAACGWAPGDLAP